MFRRRRLDLTVFIRKTVTKKSYLTGLILSKNFFNKIESIPLMSEHLFLKFNSIAILSRLRADLLQDR
jgi:hypothetical protein